MMESKCPKCGKNHIPAPQHVFKDEEGYYCSWTCFFHRNDGKKKKPTCKMVEVYDEDGELLRRFKSANDASDLLGFSVQMIAEACRLGRKYQGFYWKYKD